MEIQWTLVSSIRRFRFHLKKYPIKRSSFIIVELKNNEQDADYQRRRCRKYFIGGLFPLFEFEAE